MKFYEVPVGSFTVNQVNRHDLGNMIIYGSGIWISIVFMIFGHFPFEGGSGLPPGPMTYKLFNAPSHKDQKYIFFKGRDLDRFLNILALPVQGGSGLTPWDHVLHAI